MTNSEPPDSSTSEPKAEPEVEETRLFEKKTTWLKALRFLVAVIIIFVGLIEYKIHFPNQNIVVDILAFGIISSLVAPVAGISIHRMIAKVVRTVFEVPWS